MIKLDNSYGVKMQIKIEFKTENLNTGSNYSALLLSMSAEMIETTCFVRPVRFRVGDVDLFEKFSFDQPVFVCHVERDMDDGTEDSEETSRWNSLPLLHFAAVGYERVRNACLGERERVFYHLPGGGYLQFGSTGDRWVEISSSLSQRTVKASCTELLGAFEDFCKRVRRFIIQDTPELKNHPAWNTWFEAD
jgi:hypothetical protein